MLGYLGTYGKETTSPVCPHICRATWVRSRAKIEASGLDRRVLSIPWQKACLVPSVGAGQNARKAKRLSEKSSRPGMVWEGTYQELCEPWRLRAGCSQDVGQMTHLDFKKPKHLTARQGCLHIPACSADLWLLLSNRVH